MKRIFVAIKIPVSDFLKQSINSYQFAFKYDNIKWVELYNLHLTLLFLGDTDEGLIPGVIDNLKKLQDSVKSFKIKLKGLGVFSNIYNPRVLWIGVEPIEEFMILKEMIEKQLIDLDHQYNTENSDNPHLTIARIKNIKNNKKLKNTLGFNKHTLFQEITVNKFTLLESQLTPKGPIYSVISDFYLR